MRAGTLALFVAAVTLVPLNVRAASVSPGFNPAAASSAPPPPFGLPFASGEQALLLQGPHTNNADVCNYPTSGAHCNALDLRPSSGAVRAAGAGTVHIFSYCQPGLVAVDHGDGWWTGYYHLTNVAVSNGERVAQGQLLGDVGETLPCGGFANTPHVHFFVKYVPPGQSIGDIFQNTSVDVDLQGFTIAGWLISGRLHSACMTYQVTREQECVGHDITNYAQGGAGTLDFIKTQNTASGHVELFEIPGPNYKAPPTVATPTWFSAADWDNGAFQMDGSTLVFIKYINTGSGKVELFEIHGPNYTAAPAVATPTWFSPADAFNGWWQMEGSTLVFIKVLNTASGHVELYEIPGPNYTSAPTVATTTWFSSGDAYNGVFQLVGSSLVFIKTRNTGSGKVELFKIPGPNYNAAPTVATPTGFSPGDANNGDFQMDGSTLVFIKTLNTGSGTVELFEIPGPNYNAAPTVATPTAFSSRDANNGWFQLDGK